MNADRFLFWLDRWLMNVDKSKDKRLYQQVADKLLKQITLGKYQSNNRLPSERDLAEIYGVSRPTIREAVIALEISGNVEVRNGAGVFVLDKNLSEAVDEDVEFGPLEILEARRSFESEAAAIAATQVTESDIIAMEKIASALHKIDSDDRRKIMELDSQFHLLVSKATRNLATENTLKTLWDGEFQSLQCSRILSDAHCTCIKSDAVNYIYLVEALKSANAAEARKAFRSHFANLIESVILIVEHESIEKTKIALAAKRKRFLNTDI